MRKISRFILTAALVLFSVGYSFADAPESPAGPASTPSATSSATAPASPAPNYGVQYSGVIEGYYLYQFNNPKGGLLTGPHLYDIRHNTPTLALAELNVFKNAKPGGLGFKTTLAAGDVADIDAFEFVAGSPPAIVPPKSTLEGRWKSILQAYGTYAFAGVGGGLDIGKFVTPFGYEYIESNSNGNYSHSVIYFYIPSYNFGVRAYTPSYNGLVLTGYVVNAVNNTPSAGVGDDNHQPAVIGQAAWTDPKGKWIVNETFGSGKDKFNAAVGLDTVNNKVTDSDTNITRIVSPATILGADYTYVRTEPDNNSGGTFKSTNSGYAVYLRQALTVKTGVALRYSSGEQKSDRLGFSTIRPWEITATYEIRRASNFTTRFEYRHDGANVTTFVDSNSLVTKKAQDTASVSGMFTF